MDLDSKFLINLVVEFDATELAKCFKVPVTDVLGKLRTTAAHALRDVIGAGCANEVRGCDRILNLSPMRAVGRISYSWYL